jgi:hypothetical protein
MDQLRELMGLIQSRGLARDNLLGLLHVLIGRRINRPDGTVVSVGLTWRDAAALLKRVRWDRKAVAELGLDPAALPPRDRERFWYTAIARAGVDSAAAVAAGDRLAEELRALGFETGQAPGKS